MRSDGYDGDTMTGGTSDRAEGRPSVDRPLVQEGATEASHRWIVAPIARDDRWIIEAVAAVPSQETAT